jgi:predicted type IV restriction endonuclease
MQDLKDTIRVIASKAQDYKKRQVREEATKLGLIQPLFQELGWDFSDFDIVEPEFPVKLDGETKPADYALKVEKNPHLLIEAKGINSHIKAAIKDGTEKALEKKIPWLIATNGDTIAVLKVEEKISELERTVFQISLIDSLYEESDLKDILNYLSLLSPENVGSGVLESYANNQIERNRITNTIKNLLYSEEFRNLIKEKYKEQYRYDEADQTLLKEIVENIKMGTKEEALASIQKQKVPDPKLIEQRQARLFKHPGKTQKNNIKKHIKERAELWTEFIQRGKMSSQEFKDFSHFEPHAVAGFNGFLTRNGLAAYVGEDPIRKGAIYEINKEIIPKIKDILAAT